MADEDNLRPEWLAFERELGFRPQLRGPTYDDIIQQDTATGKAMLEKYNFPGPDPSIETSWYETSSGVRLKSYRPPTYKPNRPVICYIHGGGFVIGSVTQDDSKVNQLCKDSGCVFVSVEYRLAPQHKFPAGFDDCVEGAKWCVENAEHLGGSKGPIVIMGKSAGGSLAFGVALKLIEEGRGGDVKGVVSCQPLTVHPDAVPDGMKAEYTSYDENADITPNTKDVMHAFYNLYEAPLDNPYIWCLLNPNIGSLPRVYMNGCGADTLRDDARLMKAILDKHKVPNQYDEYAKLPHYFFTFPSTHLEALRREYFSKTAKGIAWVINDSMSAL